MLIKKESKEWINAKENVLFIIKVMDNKKIKKRPQVN